MFWFTLYLFNYFFCEVCSFIGEKWKTFSLYLYSNVWSTFLSWIFYLNITVLSLYFDLFLLKFQVLSNEWCTIICKCVQTSGQSLYINYIIWIMILHCIFVFSLLCLIVLVCDVWTLRVCCCEEGLFVSGEGNVVGRSSMLDYP